MICVKNAHLGGIRHPRSIGESVTSGLSAGLAMGWSATARSMATEWPWRFRS
jgi:hypothetical protein